VVELGDVDPRLAEEAEHDLWCGGVDELLDLLDADAARVGDARDLSRRIRGGDVGVEPAGVHGCSWSGLTPQIR
jgi:hypothetical protein